MRELWRATGMVVVDQTLREKVSAAAEVEVWEDYKDKAQWRQQPKLEALKKIGEAFGSLKLAVYDLSELNRWFLKDYEVDADGKRLRKTSTFSDELANYRKAVEDVLGDKPSDGLLEALGVLVSDPIARHRFGMGMAHLRDYGFQFQGTEEEDLRALMTPSSVASQKAEKIFGLGWDSTSSCLSRLLPSADYPHVNM